MLKKANVFITDFLKSFWDKSIPSQEITPKLATEIQKQAYLSYKQEYQKECMPPYLTIAEQLQASDKQIFEAAGFYLCMIAGNEQKYTQEIVHLLKDYIKNRKNPRERTEYLKKLMQIYFDNHKK